MQQRDSSESTRHPQATGAAAVTKVTAAGQHRSNAAGSDPGAREAALLPDAEAESASGSAALLEIRYDDLDSGVPASSQ